MAEQNGAHHSTQVRIHLKAKDGTIELPQETGPILVTTDLKRYQLSTLVNRLLATEKPIPLEFLINGQFLRTSLDDFLTQNGISAETTLSVEYVKALVPPLHIASYEEDDWISTVDILSNTSPASQWSSTAQTQPRLLSGSFDGILRVWNTTNSILAQGSWHRDSIHAAKWLSPTSIVSAGTDKSIHIWDYSDGDGLTADSGSLKPKLELQGHKSLVDSLAVHGPSQRILSGSADHTVGVWTSAKNSAPPAPEVQAPTSTNKRRKPSAPVVEVATRGALAMLSGHTQDVRDVCFDARDATVAYSVSLDHTLKTWDLPTGKCVDTKSTNQSLLALCHLQEHSLIATGGSLRYIDLIDLRASAVKVSALRCEGHTNWIRSIARNPENSFQFVSASDDSTCRIWDIRNAGSEAEGSRVARPVYTIERASVNGAKQEQGSESTVYSVAWDQEVGVVSSGRDKCLQVNRSP